MLSSSTVRRAGRRRPARPSRLAAWLPLLVLVFGLLFTALAARYATSAAHARDLIRFEVAARQVGDSIATRLDTYVAMLRAGTGLFAAFPAVSAEAFRRYVAQLDLPRVYPGIQGIGFTARVPPPALDGFVAAQRRGAHPDFRLWPAGARPEYHAIVYLEPLDRRNRAAIGYDMFSEPVRRRAMEEARDSGRPAASGRVVLVQEIDERKQAGFLIYVPVYRVGAPTASVPERRAALEGFVYSPFRAGDLLESALGDAGERLLDVQVFDVEEAAPPSLLHDTAEPGTRAGVSALTATRTVEVAGRTWRLDLATRPGFERSPGGTLVPFIVGVGVLTSVLLAAATFAQVRARGAAERTAEDLARLSGARSESEARRAAMLETALDAVITIDVEGRILEFNPAAEQMFGYRRVDVIDRPMAPLIVPPALRARHRAGFARYLRTGEAHILNRRIALTACAADGREFPVEVAVTRISHDGPPMFTAYLRDITEAKRVEEERRQLLERERAARAEAEKANRAKDEFLALLSHELRTPLTSILGWARMITNGRVAPDRIPHALTVIERNASAQTQLINDLLDLTRIISGRLRLDLRPVDLGAVVDVALETVRPAAEAKGLALVWQRPPAPVPVTGDGERLQQVLWNVVSNAVKFTPAPGRVEAVLERADGGARITVRDTGVGIEPSVLPFVFERFRQADSSPSRRHGGLGLGLTIARHVVEQHGGRIAAASEGPGRGTVVTIDLPDAPVTPAEAPPAEAPPAETRASRASLSHVQVLLVEDDADVREALATMLTTAGARVTAVDSAEAALRAVEASPPDVVVSDIAMAGLDGYALLEELRRRRPEGSALPALALTAYARPEDRERALAAGFHDHVAKPVDPQHLTAAVAALVAPPARAETGDRSAI